MASVSDLTNPKKTHSAAPIPQPDWRKQEWEQAPEPLEIGLDPLYVGSGKAAWIPNDLEDFVGVSAAADVSDDSKKQAKFVEKNPNIFNWTSAARGGAGGSIYSVPVFGIGLMAGEAATAPTLGDMLDPNVGMGKVGTNFAMNKMPPDMRRAAQMYLNAPDDERQMLDNAAEAWKRSITQEGETPAGDYNLATLLNDEYLYRSVGDRYDKNLNAIQAQYIAAQREGGEESLETLKNWSEFGLRAFIFKREKIAKALRAAADENGNVPPAEYKKIMEGEASKISEAEAKDLGFDKNTQKGMSPAAHAEWAAEMAGDMRYANFMAAHNMKIANAMHERYSTANTYAGVGMAVGAFANPVRAASATRNFWMRNANKGKRLSAAALGKEGGKWAGRAKKAVKGIWQIAGIPMAVGGGVVAAKVMEEKGDTEEDAFHNAALGATAPLMAREVLLGLGKMAAKRQANKFMKAGEEGAASTLERQSNALAETMKRINADAGEIPLTQTGGIVTNKVDQRELGAIVMASNQKVAEAAEVIAEHDITGIGDILTKQPGSAAAARRGATAPSPRVGKLTKAYAAVREALWTQRNAAREGIYDDVDDLAADIEVPHEVAKILGMGGDAKKKKPVELSKLIRKYQELNRKAAGIRNSTSKTPDYRAAADIEGKLEEFRNAIASLDGEDEIGGIFEHAQNQYHKVMDAFNNNPDIRRLMNKRTTPSQAAGILRQGMSNGERAAEVWIGLSRALGTTAPGKAYYAAGGERAAKFIGSLLPDKDLIRFHAKLREQANMGRFAADEMNSVYGMDKMTGYAINAVERLFGGALDEIKKFDDMSVDDIAAIRKSARGMGAERLGDLTAGGQLNGTRRGALTADEVDEVLRAAHTQAAFRNYTGLPETADIASKAAALRNGINKMIGGTKGSDNRQRQVFDMLFPSVLRADYENVLKIVDGLEELSKHAKARQNFRAGDIEKFIRRTQALTLRAMRPFLRLPVSIEWTGLATTIGSMTEVMRSFQTGKLLDKMTTLLYNRDKRLFDAFAAAEEGNPNVFVKLLLAADKAAKPAALTAIGTSEMRRENEYEPPAVGRRTGNGGRRGAGRPKNGS